MALCTCPKCGHAWNYRGKAVGDQYICCPACGREWENPGYDEKHGICMNPGFEPVEGEAI